MPITNVEKNPETRSMRVTAEFAAPVERVWRLWSDPRQLERWWGPPVYPATVVEHDLRPGGRVTYYMTGPEGDQPKGWWRILAVDAPHTLELEDGFADDDYNENPELPTMRMTVRLEAIAGGTRMSVTSVFPTLEAMERILAMGAEEGMKQAMGQIDGILAEAA